MSKLPNYLDKTLNMLAAEEEAQGGMKKAEAYRTFKEELFADSLTARANPSKKNEKKDEKVEAIDRVKLLEHYIKNQPLTREQLDYFNDQLEKAKKAAKNPGKTRRAAGLSAADFHPDVLEKGVTIELEHTDDENEAREIAMDHLSEDRKYYDKLAKMESVASHDSGRRPERVGSQPKAGACDMKIDSNPSIKPFHEIYKTVAQEYNESPLAKKFLGTLQKGTYKRGHKEVESFGKTGKDYKNQGIRFFEELRNFSANTAKIFVEEILKERLSRPNKAEKKSWSNRGATEIAAFEKETLADANQMSLFAEGKITKGEAKYGAKNLDRNEVLLDIEKIRYMRLMISAIVTALVKPIFEADKEKLELLLRVYPMFQDPNLKYLMTADARTTFVEGVIETTEFQLTHGIEIFDVERLKKEIAMAKARKRGK